MNTVTFDVGTQPWDTVQGQVLEADGVGPSPGWRDAATNARFEIVLGRMFVAPVLDSQTRRLLVQKPLATDERQRTILAIKLPDGDWNVVKFRLGGETYPVPVTIEYFDHPGYGTGGRPGPESLVTRSSIALTGGSTVEHRNVCRAVTEVWIAIDGSPYNEIDTIEFEHVVPTLGERIRCAFSHVLPSRWLSRLTVSAAPSHT